MCPRGTKSKRNKEEITTEHAESTKTRKFAKRVFTSPRNAMGEVGRSPGEGITFLH
jgi:hypothetical protein